MLEMPSPKVVVMGAWGVTWGYGVGTAQGNLEELRGHARWAERAGFDGLWISQIFGVDPIVALAALGPAFPGFRELGTSVVPLTGRHPMSLAPAALTAQAATEGRFTLGIGPSHKMVAEGFFGESYARPFTRTKEFVEALTGLFQTGAASVDGEEIFSSGWLTIDAPPVPILLAALGPRMLELAGTSTAGTSLGSCGPHTISSHIKPRLDAAAARVGRPKPRIMALVSVCATDRVEERRAQLTKGSELYAALPSYRAMLDIEGVASPADLHLLGDERSIVEGLERYVEAGVTDIRLGIATDDVVERARTRTFIEELLASV